jgi:XTP/dITP diphosphohydrolase
MNELIVATRNRGKLKEIEAFLSGLVPVVRCTADFPDFPETVEDGATFQENALKKAREAAAHTGLPALADDSGLVVDALAGCPGVYSARYAGDNADDTANNSKLLQELQGVGADERVAAFVCSMALVTPDGDEQLFTGRVGGAIIDAAQGDNGFGYDPLFLVDGFGRTMAELSLDEKNRVSHRGQALRQLKAYLEQRQG